MISFRHKTPVQLMGDPTFAPNPMTTNYPLTKTRFEPVWNFDEKRLLRGVPVSVFLGRCTSHTHWVRYIQVVMGMWSRYIKYKHSFRRKSPSGAVQQRQNFDGRLDIIVKQSHTGARVFAQQSHRGARFFAQSPRQHLLPGGRCLQTIDARAQK